MVEIAVRQFMNGEWHLLGQSRFSTGGLAIDWIDKMQRKINESNDNIIPIRQDVNGLMIINLDHGPIRFNITN
jgi:hypothetical protein